MILVVCQFCSPKFMLSPCLFVSPLPSILRAFSARSRTVVFESEHHVEDVLHMRCYNDWRKLLLLNYMIHFASKYTTTEPLCKEFAVQLSFLLWLRRVLLNCCPRLRASSHLGDICHLGSRRTGRRTESRGRIQLNQISPSFDMEFQSSLK